MAEGSSLLLTFSSWEQETGRSLFLDQPRTPERKTRLQREIKATDRQIDQLVYELYGLTKD